VKRFCKLLSRLPLRRTHVALIAIVAAYTVFDFFTIDSHRANWLNELMAGVWFSQSILFATWAAIGPPPAVKRIPLTVAALCLVTIAMLLQPTSTTARDGAETLLVNSGIFLTAFALQWGSFKFLRLRIRTDSHENVAASNHFGIRYLLALTAVVAIVLAIGRLIAEHLSLSSSSFVHSPLEFLGFLTAISLALGPLIAVPLLALSRRTSFRAIAGIILIWFLSYISAILVITLIDPDPWYVLVREIAFLQLGIGTSGVMSGVVLRIAGYRLVRSTQTKSTHVIATPL
jgi:hypothetical protein